MRELGVSASRIRDVAGGLTTRRQALIRAGGLGASVAVGSLLSACGSGDSSSTTASGTSGGGGTPVRGGDLVYAWPYEPGNVLSPGMPPGGTAGELFPQLQIFDQLLVIEPGSLDLKPGLASEWEQSADGKTYHFTLRDAEFSNGMPVTVEDVKFSLDRFRDPRRNLYSLFVASLIDTVTVKDRRTVEVRLLAPAGAFLDYLSIIPASIVPARLLQRLGERGFEKQPVGSGPFKLVERQKGRSLQLERNDNYWRPGKPYLDSVRYEYVADEESRILRLTTGEAHIAATIPIAQMRRADASSGVTVQVDDIGSVAVVWFGPRLRPLHDRDVNVAMNLTAPRDAMRESIFNNVVDIANSHLMPLRYWDADVEPYALDLDLAKQHMARSGYPDGFEMEIMYVGGDTQASAIATLLQEAWAPIGIRIKQQQVEVGTFNARRADYRFDTLLAFDLTSDIAVEDEMALFYRAAEFGPSAYRDDHASKLVRRASTSTDDAERRRLFGELQRYGMEVYGPNVPLFFLKEITALRDNVHGFKPTVLDTIRFEDVWMSKA